MGVYMDVCLLFIVLQEAFSTYLEEGSVVGLVDSFVPGLDQAQVMGELTMQSLVWDFDNTFPLN